MENCHGTAKFCGRILLHHCGIEDICIFIVGCYAVMLEHCFWTEEHGDVAVRFCVG